MENNNKIVVTVEFKDQAKADFLELKQKLRMENSNDVIRWAIGFANKKNK